MDFRFAFFLLLIAGAFFAESSGGDVPRVEFTRVANGDGGLGTWKACDGLAGDCPGEEEEMGMESEVSRRGLRAQVRYISYAALSRNRVPCNQRGQSYYNCQQGQRANPYRRGCSIITQCARILY